MNSTNAIVATSGENSRERPFVHLHCHSHYSLLDGAGDIGRLVGRCVDHGMNALALTDHGNLHGALEFYRKCKAADVNPIIGYEAYIAPGSRFDKGGATSSKAASYHLTLLAQNRVGFKNLVKLASAASLEGFYFKPRIDKEILEKYSEGIVCLSGCVSSEFSRAVIKGIDTAEHEKEARDIAGWFHNVFDDRYFIEIMNNDVDIQKMQLDGAVQIAQRMGIPLVATSDTHYVDPEDAEAQDIMLCINTGRFRTDTSRMKMENDQFFLRSPEQMYEKFPGLDHAVARSQEIADAVDIDLELGKYYFPRFECPGEQAPIDYLRELCIHGLMQRYEDDPERIVEGKLSDEVMARLDRELDVIEKLGYPTYFLIVWDFVNHARERGISATARGSGVGAIVCYALYMSHVCPLRYDLLFERFLDESRTEPPDIDIDFEKERRGEVIEYVKQRVWARDGLPDRHLRNACRPSRDQGHRTCARRATGPRQPGHRNGARRIEDHDQESAGKKRRPEDDLRCRPGNPRVVGPGDEDRRSGTKRRHPRSRRGHRRQAVDRVRPPGTRSRQAGRDHSMADGRRRSVRAVEDGFPGSAKPDHPQPCRPTDRTDDRKSGRPTEVSTRRQSDLRAITTRRNERRLSTRIRRHPRFAAANEARPISTTSSLPPHCIVPVRSKAVWSTTT